MCGDDGGQSPRRSPPVLTEELVDEGGEVGGDEVGAGLDAVRRRRHARQHEREAPAEGRRRRRRRCRAGRRSSRRRDRTAARTTSASGAWGLPATTGSAPDAGADGGDDGAAAGHRAVGRRVGGVVVRRQEPGAGAHRGGSDAEPVPVEGAVEADDDGVDRRRVRARRPRRRTPAMAPAAVDRLGDPRAAGGEDALARARPGSPPPSGSTGPRPSASMPCRASLASCSPTVG